MEKEKGRLELRISKPDDYYRCLTCGAEYSEEGRKLKKCKKCCPNGEMDITTLS